MGSMADYSANLTIIKKKEGTEEHLLGCSDYIYCDNDNSSSDTLVVTQEFIDSLEVGDKLVLSADGDGEHC